MRASQPLSVRGRDRLAQTGERLARWRAQHGGPGIPVPEALWPAGTSRRTCGAVHRYPEHLDELINSRDSWVNDGVDVFSQ
jgi:hypothetical protein